MCLELESSAFERSYALTPLKGLRGVCPPLLSSCARVWQHKIGGGTDDTTRSPSPFHGTPPHGTPPSSETVMDDKTMSDGHSSGLLTSAAVRVDDVIPPQTRPLVLKVAPHPPTSDSNLRYRTGTGHHRYRWDRTYLPPPPERTYRWI